MTGKLSDDNTLIIKNVESVRSRIHNAAHRAGVKPDSIMLVAAAKTKDTAAVLASVAAGVDAVGENRVQELLLKHGEGAYTDIPLHFIGHLQTNKVTKIVGKTSLIHSVDSRELIEIIDKFAGTRGIVQDILIELNIADELSKSGVPFSQVRSLLDFAASFNNIKVKGLMTIPPVNASESETRRFFQKIYKLFVDISHEKRHNVIMTYLSMGMSGDFETAIQEGSNMVRVGSAIFGHR